MEVQKIQSYILEKLHRELPEWLTYHNAEHTEIVIRNAIELGELEGLGTEELQLLQTAALMHDAGFLSAYKTHEEASCNLSRELLPQYGYTPSQVETVCEIIMYTKVPQQPKKPQR